MEYGVAKEVNDIMFSISGQLNQSVAFFQTRMKDEEFIKYRRAIGAIMATMWEEIMCPLYAEHPNLKPQEIEGDV